MRCLARRRFRRRPCCRADGGRDVKVAACPGGGAAARRHWHWRRRNCRPTRPRRCCWCRWRWPARNCQPPRPRRCCLSPLASATSKRPPSPVAALLSVPSANERSPKPVADALAPLPIAIAMSPKPELAVAVLSTVENKSIPLMEICISNGDAASAGTARPLSTWSSPRKRIGGRVGRGDLRGGGQRRPDAQSNRQHAHSTATNRVAHRPSFPVGAPSGWPQSPLLRGPPNDAKFTPRTTRACVFDTS